MADFDGDDVAEQFLDAFRTQKPGVSPASLILGSDGLALRTAKQRPDNVAEDDDSGIPVADADGEGDEEGDEKDAREDASGDSSEKGVEEVFDPDAPDGAEKRKLRKGKFSRIDLNSEDAVVNESEDKDLRAHMQRAREKLIDLEKQSVGLPDVAKLKTLHTQNLRTLSSAFKDFTRRLGEYQTAIEMTILQSSNSVKLSAGERPHGFPEVKEGRPENAGSLTHMSKKISENGESHQALHEAFSSIHRSLSALRRDYETVVDGFMRIAQHDQEMYEAAAGGLAGGPR